MLEIQAPYPYCPPPIPTHHLLSCSLLFICRFSCFMPLIQGSWDFVLARTINALQIFNQSVFFGFVLGCLWGAKIHVSVQRGINNLNFQPFPKIISNTMKGLGCPKSAKVVG